MEVRSVDPVVSGDDESLPRNKRREWMISAFPPVVGSIAFLLGVAFAPTHGSQEFFVTCAGIIPLFLLALALDARVLKLDSPPFLRLDSKWLEQEAESLRDNLDALQEMLAEAGGLPDGDPAFAFLEGETEGLGKAVSSFMRRLKRYKTTWMQASFVYGVWVSQVVLGGVVLLIAEVKALVTIADAAYRHADPSFPFGAVILGFVAILMAALQRPARS